MKRRLTVNNKKTKILILGDSQVGKTSFIEKFAGNFFQINSLSTQGIEYYPANIKLQNGKEYPVNFFDTAGQEKFKSIALTFIKKTDGIILMYDITLKSSFASIPFWMEQIKENKGENYPIILCGNKCDLEEKRVISKEEGKEIAKKFGIAFFEISSQNEKNLKNVGNEIIKQILEKKEKEKNDILKDFVLLEKDSFELNENDIKKRYNNSYSIKGNRQKCKSN